jgi:hypothetical protein
MTLALIGVAIGVATSFRPHARDIELPIRRESLGPMVFVAVPLLLSVVALLAV